MTQQLQRVDFEIKPATRVGVSPLIVPYSESGCGKTFSALLLARGLAGPSGKIVVADSESRRASLYADVIPGGFDTFDLAQPFTPARYIGAVDAIEASGAAVGIIDSGSHEWEGPSGILDMADANEEKSGKPGLHNWRKPKFEHAQFVARLLRTKIPFIICLRAKYKSRQGKNPQTGKTEIIKDDKTSPIQAEDFIFEATCHFEILPDHSIILTKCSHPDLRGCFPEKGKPIEIRHGEMIGEWCQGGAAKQSAAPPRSAGRPDGKVAELQTVLWKALKSVRTASDKPEQLGQVDAWLAVHKITSTPFQSLTREALQEAIEKSEIVMMEAANQ